MKANKFYFITLIIVLFTLGGIVHAQANLIKNSSFEKIDANGNPEDWRTHCWTNDQAVTTFSVDNSAAHSGNNSVVVNNLQPNHAYFIQTVPVKEKSFYKATGWVKTENVGENMEGAGISVIDYFEVGGDFRGTNNWQPGELYISTGPGITFVDIQLQVGNYGAENTGKAWFDDISMIKVDSPPEGAKVTVMGKKDDTSQSGADQGKSNTEKDAKPNATLALLIIIIIIVIVVGIAVIILIVLTRKKPGTDEKIDDAGSEDESEPDTE